MIRIPVGKMTKKVLIDADDIYVIGNRVSVANSHWILIVCLLMQSIAQISFGMSFDVIGIGILIGVLWAVLLPLFHKLKRDSAWPNLLIFLFPFTLTASYFIRHYGPGIGFQFITISIGICSMLWFLFRRKILNYFDD